MRLVFVSLASASLALAGCGQSNPEDAKALAVSIAAKGCETEGAAEMQTAGIDPKKMCGCVAEKMFKDVSADKFASLNTEEEANAFIQTLEPQSTQGALDCVAELYPNGIPG